MNIYYFATLIYVNSYTCIYCIVYIKIRKKKMNKKKQKKKAKISKSGDFETYLVMYDIKWMHLKTCHCVLDIISTALISFMLCFYLGADTVFVEGRRMYTFC